MLTRIGITGGIGSGKTEVCKRFAALGVTTLSADAIAHHLTDSDPVIRDHIITRFGPTAYDRASSALNRRFIADLVFEDPKKLSQLNAIVHPAVFKTIDQTILELEKHLQKGYVLIEAALLFESNFHNRMDYVLTVVSEESSRVQRIRMRDRSSEEQVRKRMAYQIPAEDAIAESDFVLYNDDSLDALQARVVFFHTIFTTLTTRLKRTHEPH
jgi:dephospho-CoA kinase